MSEARAGRFLPRSHSRYGDLRLAAPFVLIALFLMPIQARADIEVRAEYHAPTDLFALMDGVSGWLFNDRAYREYWAERFGWSGEDEAFVVKYKAYRDRVFDDRGQYDAEYRARNDGIFATRSSLSQDTDPLGEHFIAAASIDEALASLDRVASDEDAAMLRAFYAHFRPKWELVLKESASFNAPRAETLDRALRVEGTDEFLERLTAFYRVEGDYQFTARYVWWPPINRSLADITGRTFFLRNHPENYPDQTRFPSIVIHEAVHYVSAFQPIDQKVALTARFRERCPVDLSTAYEILEEPLAVAWQGAFKKHVQKEPFRPSEQWYYLPLVDVMARLIWPHVDALYGTDATIADGVVDEVAKHCAHLLEITETIGHTATDGPDE